MRAPTATHNLCAVSANAAETALNSEQSLDTAMLVDMGDIANLEPRRENNADEANGKEEADEVYDLGATASMSWNNSKAQPQHFAFIMAYGLGSVSTAAAGAGYEHTITPTQGDLDASRSNPTFTLAQRQGKTIFKRRYASFAVDSFAATFAKDDWVKLTASLKGTGKYTDSVVEEIISAPENSASISLAVNGVAGATAADRLNSIHQIKAELTPGVWTEVDYSAVSSAAPAAITITAPGTTTTAVNFKVLYAPTEAAWMAFPNRVTESPLRVAQMNLTIGGTWDGTAFTGGRALSSEVKSIEYNCNNNMQVEFTPGAGGAYASRAIREGRVQAVSLSRELRDFIMQNYINSNEYFGLHIICVGKEFDTGQNYQVEIILPRLGVLKSPVSVDGKRLAETGDLTVLEDAVYGSAIVKVKNMVSGYAA